MFKREKCSAFLKLFYLKVKRLKQRTEQIKNKILYILFNKSCLKEKNAADIYIYIYIYIYVCIYRI